MSLEIKIKYYADDAKRLEKIEKGDWIDVYADSDLIIFEGEHEYIPLGFACKLPEGYEAHLAPRSSTFKNWGLVLTNSFGIIDESYCGEDDEWKLSVYCLQGKHETVRHLLTYDADGYEHEVSKLIRFTKINRGDKIAQFRIVEKMPDVVFKEVGKLDNENRGGFGSTGTK